MVGDDNFGLMEWKKLMTDSLKQSVWNKKDKGADEIVRKKVWAEWEAQYKEFVYMIKDKYSYLLEGSS